MPSIYNIYKGLTAEDNIKSFQKRGYTIVRYKALPVVVAFLKHPDGQVSVAIWKGNGYKTAFYYILRNEQRAQTEVKNFVDSVTRSIERKAAEKAEKKAKRAALKASDHYTVGDVLVNMWGYEQTNIDYYQVIEVKAKSIVIREICANSAETGHMQGTCQPRRNDFAKDNKPITKMVSPEGYVSADHGSLSKWDGKASHWTTYY